MNLTMNHVSSSLPTIYHFYILLVPTTYHTFITFLTNELPVFTEPLSIEEPQPPQVQSMGAKWVSVDFKESGEGAGGAAAGRGGLRATKWGRKPRAFRLSRGMVGGGLVDELDSMSFENGETSFSW